MGRNVEGEVVKWFLTQLESLRSNILTLDMIKSLHIF